MSNVLEVDGLSVAFATEDGVLDVVGGVGFSVGEGATLGIVGESGCGKSVTALAIMGLRRGRPASSRVDRFVSTAPICARSIATHAPTFAAARCR